MTFEIVRLCVEGGGGSDPTQWKPRGTLTAKGPICTDWDPSERPPVCPGTREPPPDEPKVTPATTATTATSSSNTRTRRCRARRFASPINASSEKLRRGARDSIELVSLAPELLSSATTQGSFPNTGPEPRGPTPGRSGSVVVDSTVPEADVPAIAQDPTVRVSWVTPDDT